MNHRVRWHLGALASVVALLASLASLDAQALALGRVTVQSALGEPLRAEIDIAEITADEAASLRSGVGNADAFKAAGLEYTPAVIGVQVTLQKRSDGRSYLRLSSSRPVAEPFVDLVLEASWSSGRIVRDYTLLFDPPSLRSGSAVGAAPITAPVLPRQSAPAGIPPARDISPYYPTSPLPPRAAAVAPAPAPTRAAPQESRARAPAPATASAPAGEKRVAVKPGDTASKIAAQNKPASVSLDQMLVALLRSNPDAFIGGNINRLKAGSVLDIPAANDATAISPTDASRTIVAQSTDFNDFRRKLAEGVPTTQAGSASRQAAGKVQAKVEDRAAAATAPDKLTLSKGAVQEKVVAEEKIAKDRQAKDASTRVAELTKNIADLNKLTGSPVASGAAPAAAASSAKSPGVAIAGSNLTPPAATASSAPLIAASAAKIAASSVTSVVTATPGVTPTSTTVATLSPTVAPMTASVTSTISSSANVSSATTAAAVAVATLAKPASSAASASSPVVKKPAAAPPPEPSLIDELTDNPFVLPGAGLLLVLLGAFGFYRYKRKRNDAAQLDSSFLESRLQPDSFFGASGGQRIDTSEGGATGSSLVYSPSQLDAAGDVDPVAEADVYLAYGRDLQAEEILKEAIRTSPTRVAIHAKLMEIYAKRRDIKAFEVVAAEAFNLTHGQGPEWAYISELGRDLDPGNPMYQPGGQPHAASKASEENARDDATAAFGSSTIPQMLTAHPEVAAAPMDFDLDLDFSIGDEPTVTTAPVPAPPVATAPAPAYESEPTIAMQLPADPIFDGLEMDFPLDDTVAIKPTPEAPAAQATAPPPAPPPASVVAALDSGMLEFDLGSLSLDLGGPITESPSLAASGASALSVSDDPLETKFALAEEFRTLGDTDGARSLAEEVASQAKGPLKAKAQSFLASLS
jgi:pilus assembly protein FimV